MFGPTTAKQQDIDAENRREDARLTEIYSDIVQFEFEKALYEARGCKPSTVPLEIDKEERRENMEEKMKFDFSMPDAQIRWEEKFGHRRPKTKKKLHFLVKIFIFYYALIYLFME
jgi:hypothetical protein